MNSSSSSYTEKHHIIPKSIDKNSKETVRLSAREHFIVHLLLPRFLENIQHKTKMVFALWGICNQSSSDQKRIIVNSKSYERVKKAHSESISGDKHWMKREKNRQRQADIKRGQKMSEETKQKLSQCFKGRRLLWGDKIGAANKGKKRTAKMNKAQSDMMKIRHKNGIWKSPTEGLIREKFPCQYCGRYFDVANLQKWHGDKCKQKHTIQ